MSLADQINQDLVSAIKSGDQFRRDALRYLKSQLQNAQIEKRSALTDEETISLLRKEAKRCQETITALGQAKATSQIAAAKQELNLLNGYLPTQLQKDEIEQEIIAYLQKTPADSWQIGPAMAGLRAQFQGRADMSEVAIVVRRLLTKESPS